MWKKIIKDAPTQVISQLCSTAALPDAPVLFCSFKEKNEPENVIFMRPLKEFAGIQMDLSIFSNFCVYQNVSE
jgi:hypothetical protein